MGQGRVFRRCGCRSPETGTMLGAGCPRLASSPRHGSWYLSVELPAVVGQRRRVRRGGYRTRAAAVEALEKLQAPRRPQEPGLTVGAWLQRWLDSRVSLRPSTVVAYQSHLRGYLLPHLGGVRLDELTVAEVRQVRRAGECAQAL